MVPFIHSLVCAHHANIRSAHPTDVAARVCKQGDLHRVLTIKCILFANLKHTAHK